MKHFRLLLSLTLLLATAFAAFSFGNRTQQGSYILQHEKDIAKEEPGTHNGTGITTGYSFFAGTPGLHLAFRKRVLKPGSSIGYHLQKEDEIYYVLSGTGLMRMNNDSFAVKAGDAVLTRPGASHSLAQTGKEDLVIMINYAVQ